MVIAWTFSSSKGPWQKSATVWASFRTCEVLLVSALGKSSTYFAVRQSDVQQR